MREDEEKVEKVVSEEVIEAHEEAGELIPWLAGTCFWYRWAALP